MKLFLKIGNVIALNLFKWVLVPMPKKLEWKYEENGNYYYAEMPLTYKRYSIKKVGDLFHYKMPLSGYSYRSSFDEAVKACQQHYCRNMLKLNGIIDKN